MLLIKHITFLTLLSSFIPAHINTIMPKTKTTQRKAVKHGKDEGNRSNFNNSHLENNRPLHGLPNLNHKRRSELIKIFKDDTGLVLEEDVVIPIMTASSSSNFIIKELTNEGNSLYSAVCYLLFKNTEFHSHLRDAIMNFMRRNATALNTSEYVRSSGYETVEHYMKETQCDELGRLPNGGLIELASIAMYFNIPVYLFTEQAHKAPRIFSPADKRQNQQCALVLYQEFDAFSPVLEFECTSFQHIMERNEKLLQLLDYDQNEGIDVTCHRLNMLSAKLLNEAINHQPCRLNLRKDSFNLFVDAAIIGRLSEMEPDVHLLNFACDWNCFYLIEQQLLLFSKCKEISSLVQFVSGLRKESEKYAELLKNHIVDVCYQTSADKLSKVVNKNTDKEIRTTVEDVAKTKSKYILATKDITVALSDGTFAFKDELPFTLLVFKKPTSGLADTLQYYTGPKAKKAKWLDLLLNKRIPNLETNVSANHILFSQGSLYLYFKEKRTLGFMKNVFQYEQPFQYIDLPKPKRKLSASARLVTSYSNSNYLLDVSTKQVYSIADNEWRSLMEFETVIQTEDCQVCQFTTVVGDRETVIIAEKRAINHTSLFGFQTILDQPVIFQYTLSEDVDKFTVEKRLAEQYISLDTGGEVQEQSVASYTIVHYKFPLCRKSKCVYALIQTEPLNEMIREQQSSCDLKSIKEVILMKDHSNLFHRMCKNIGYPDKLKQKYTELLATDANTCMAKILEEWYEPAKYVCTLTNYPMKPEDLWAIAYRELKEIELYGQLILSQKQRNMLRAFDFTDVYDDVICKIQAVMLEKNKS